HLRDCDAAEIRLQIDLEAGTGARDRHRSEDDYQHQDEQNGHQHLRPSLDSVLHAAVYHQDGEEHEKCEKWNDDNGCRDEGTELRGGAEHSFEDVPESPARDDGIVTENGDARQHAEASHEGPRRAGLDGIDGPNSIRLAMAPDRELGEQTRSADEQ